MNKKILFCALLLSCVLTSHAGDYATLYRQLPVALTEPIAPTIPDNRVSLTDFGGCGDGVTLNTEAFEKAIKALSAKGGGHLVVPAGIYVTGIIQLKDNIDLHLERHAMILASSERSLFIKTDSKTGKKESKATPLISASKRHDISITGEGTIDGNGEWWRAVKRGKVSDDEWKVFREMGGTVADDGKLWYPFNLKNDNNLAETYEEQEKMRAHLIRFSDCERVMVKGVTVQNAPKFHLVPQSCHQVIFDDVTVRCPWNAQNGDGIDLMQCSDVFVTGCHLDVGDDGICLKGGVGQASLVKGPCENILITDNVVNHAHGGFVIGSEFSAGINRIVVLRNTFSGTDTGLRFKSGAGRGGTTSQIFISDIYMSDIKGEAISFETTYADRPAGSKEVSAPKGTDFLPHFTDIHISHVICRDTRTAISAHGNLDMIHDIYLDDCTFFYTKKGLDIDDAAMLKMGKVNFHTYGKP